MDTSRWEAGENDEESGDFDAAFIARRIKSGDEDAFNTFYQFFSKRLYRYLIVMTGYDEESAKDLLQDVMVRVVRYIKPFPDESALWGWLTRLARSALIDRHRRMNARIKTVPLTKCQEEILCLPGKDKKPLAELLQTGIAALSPDDQKLLAAYYDEGERLADIGAAHDTTAKAIEMRLARIRAQLRAVIMKPEAT